MRVDDSEYDRGEEQSPCCSTHYAERIYAKSYTDEWGVKRIDTPVLSFATP